MKCKFKILLLLLVLMSVNAVLSQNKNSSAFSNIGHDKLKENIFSLKHELFLNSNIDEKKKQDLLNSMIIYEAP